MRWTHESIIVVKKKRALSTLLLLSFGGCVSPPLVHEYPNLGLKIVLADSAQVAKVCRSDYNDVGIYLSNQEKPSGCWVRETGEIWIDWYAEDTTEVLLHELCHADGQPKSVCAKAFVVSSSLGTSD